MSAEARPTAQRELLSGWGRAPVSAASVFSPAREELQALLEDAPRRGLIVRGLGRSYGDAAQNAGGGVIRLARLSRILEFDPDKGLLRAESGMSLEDVFRTFVPIGWFPHVTPGTQFVTIGGAIAADIHGKNHHRDGSFSEGVQSIRLLTPKETLDVSREQDPEAFWATVGGMGLTGIILDALLQLRPIETSYMTVDTERAVDLDEAMSKMDEEDDQYQYSVAWVDCTATGKDLGRSVLTRGNHATASELPRKLEGEPLKIHTTRGIPAPPWFPPGLLNPLTVRAFNEMWFRKSPRSKKRQTTHFRSFFHPLDGVDNWNRIYGPRGFVQYQFVVPFGRETEVRQVIEGLSGAGASPFLAVLKRMGEPDQGHLSFPIAGWTLAVDIPVGAESLNDLLAGFDELVAGAGGRVYFAKDARMKPGLIPQMYPRLKSWREIRDRLDPQGVLRSDLARRLELI